MSILRHGHPRFLLLLFAVVVLITLACAPAAPPAPPPPTPAPAKPAAAPPTAAPARPASKAMEKVVARLSWTAYGGAAHWSIAKEKGYFAAEGLDVSSFEGQGGVTGLQAIASGNDDFSETVPDALFKGISQGMPLKLIAGLYDQSPMGIACQKDLNVTKPKDLEGKRLAITPGDSTLVMLPALLKTNNVDESKIIKIAVDAASKTAAVVAKRVDCATAWRNSSYVPMRQATDLSFLAFSDYGLNPMGYRLFTNEETIRKKPEVVRGFIRSTLKAMQYMREQPADAAAILVKQYPALKIEVAREQVNNSLPLMESEISKKYGHGYQDKETYEKAQEIYVQTGIMDKRIDMSKAFTNEFLK